MYIYIVLTERAYHACKCLPSCTDFDYELSYSIIKKNFRYISKSLTFMNNSTNRWDILLIFNIY